MASILGLGNYRVFLDAGFITDAFVLDDAVRGVLDNTDFVLDGVTEFFDVTDYVQAVGISRGRQKFRDPIDAGRCTIQIYDEDGDFSVVNSNSPYWDVAEDRLGFQPTKRVRVERDGERLFEGQIVTYDQRITLENESYVTVVATDDLKVFDRLTVNASFTPVEERSDERLETILDLPEVDLFTASGERVLDTGDALLGTQPVERGVTVAEYFDRVQLCEQGRIFIDRQGRFVAQKRTGRGLRNVAAEFSDLSDGDTPYRTFEVVYE
jgi:hypothetical protein